MPDYTVPQYSSMLSPTSLPFHYSSYHHHSNFTVYVDDPSNNLASKFVYLFNNSSMYLCPGSATHGKLLVTALYLTLGGAAFASMEETRLLMRSELLQLPIPKLRCIYSRSSFSFKEKVLSPAQSDLSTSDLYLIPSRLSGHCSNNYILFLSTITFFIDNIQVQEPLT